jgi:hypothetical protein
VTFSYFSRQMLSPSGFVASLSDTVNEWFVRGWGEFEGFVTRSLMNRRKNSESFSVFFAFIST